MPRIIILVLLVGLAAVSAFAQAAVSPPALDDTSRKALNQVCAQIAAPAIVRGKFIQNKEIKRLRKNFSSRGNFLFSSQDGVLWLVEKPFQSSLVMTKDRLVQKSASGKTSVMDGQSNAVFKRFADTLQSVFAGRLGALEEQFSLSFQGDAHNWTIGLVPREDGVRAVIQSMEIRGDQFIRTLRLLEANGDVNLYSFSDSQADSGLTAAERQQFEAAKSEKVSN